jgi:hypothetical protein
MARSAALREDRLNVSIVGEAGGWLDLGRLDLTDAEVVGQRIIKRTCDESGAGEG